MPKCEVFRKVHGAHNVDSVVKVGTVNVPKKGGGKKGYDPSRNHLPLATDTTPQTQCGGSDVRTRAVITNKSRQPRGAQLYRNDDE